MSKSIHNNGYTSNRIKHSVVCESVRDNLLREKLLRMIVVCPNYYIHISISIFLYYSIQILNWNCILAGYSASNRNQTSNLKRILNLILSSKYIYLENMLQIILFVSRGWKIRGELDKIIWIRQNHLN